MESFTITCTTCQQRLKVRDDSAIGEIQICPKCGSMVLVEHPSDDPPQAIERPRVDLEQPVSESAEPDASSAIEPAVALGSPVADEADTSTDANEEFAAPPIAAPQQDDSIDPDVTSCDASLDDRGEPVLPTADWTSEKSRRRQQLLLTGGAALVGMVLALGVFVFIASRAFWSPSDQPIGRSEPSGTAGAQQDREEEPSEESVDTVDPPPADLIDQTEQTPIEQTETDQASTPPADKLPDPDPPDEDPASPEAPPAVENDNGEGTKPEPVTEEPGPEPDSAATSPELSEALDQFAPFIDPDAYVPSPSEPATAELKQPELDPAESEQVGPTVPRPPPREVDVAERLNDAIPAIEFSNTPLKDLIRFLVGFSTIPITLDPDALALVGETPNSPVNIRQTDTTVGQALGEALTPLRLGAVTVGEQILVTRPTPPDGKIRTLEHPVGDLVGDDPAALSQLAELIVDVIEPDSWEESGGNGEIREAMPSLVIGQRETILFRVIVLCERLRAARGLPPQSNFDPSHFDLEPRLSRAASHLGTPVTLTYAEPTSFARVLHQLGDESHMDILIDWQAIAELGWTPDTETTVAASGEPIVDVLSGLLRPMGLTYRVIDGTFLQVTSPQVSQTRLEVEFYPSGDLLSQEPGTAELEKRVRVELGEEALEQVRAHLHVDQPSGYLIAALPQPMHRKLAEVLEAWRKRAP